jgi:iron complex outermembrane receptor protein
MGLPGCLWVVLPVQLRFLMPPCALLLRRFGLLLAACLVLTAAQAQPMGTLAGTVRGSSDGQPVAGASLIVKGTTFAATTNAEGQYRLGPIPTGTYTVQVLALGYEVFEQPLLLAAADQSLDVMLVLLVPPPQARRAMGEALVTGPVQVLDVAGLSTEDAGQWMQAVPGLGATRRGGWGLDPVVRGMAEAQLATYRDGIRLMAAGPLRTESPLALIAPATVARIRVVKGPQALTLGPGSMTALLVETRDPAEAPPGGFVQTGFATNREAGTVAFGVQGQQQGTAYTLTGAGRRAGDYTAGDGRTVAAHYQSGALQGRAYRRLNPDAHLSLGGGAHYLRAAAYPGRTLDVAYTLAGNASARYQLAKPAGVFRGVDALLAWEGLTQRLDNDDKPTAQPDTSRALPDPLRIRLDARMRHVNGRVAMTLVTDDGVQGDMGLDFNRMHYESTRDITRRDTDSLLFEDNVWPDVALLNIGYFVRTEAPLTARLRAEASLRLDLIHATIGRASAFFLQRSPRDSLTVDQLTRNESAISFLGQVSYAFSKTWTGQLSLGSVSRPAEPLERYADRFPASRSQTEAELVGGRFPESERNTQTDLTLEGRYPRLTVRLTAFNRLIGDYFTFEQFPFSVPTRLPTSPDTVYFYRNGEARFRGAEAGVTAQVHPRWRVQLDGSYLWGKDTTTEGPDADDPQDKGPAFGVPPATGRAGVRYMPGERFFAEALVQAAARQGRVATLRGEQPIGGFVTADVRVGVSFTPRLSVQAGVENLTDRSYAWHLNALNPFTGVRVPEPGRVFSGHLRLHF